MDILDIIDMIDMIDTVDMILWKVDSCYTYTIQYIFHTIYIPYMSMANHIIIYSRSYNMTQFTYIYIYIHAIQYDLEHMIYIRKKRVSLLSYKYDL